MTSAYLQRVATAVPEHDIHEPFVNFAAEMLQDSRSRKIFSRWRSFRITTTLSRLMISALELAPLVELWPRFLRFFADRTRVLQAAMRLEGIMHPLGEE
ncbi:MAG TPA: hypothetical protein VMU48_21560 [Terracidiphilus sp.]|nr:hypothetical protein [Terracidiphilus sp.]